MVNTAESYNFYTSTSSQVTPPFPGSGAVSIPTTTLVYLVNGVCSVFCGASTAPNYTYRFFYDAATELTQVVFPAGGDMRWDYVGYTYGDNRTLREVSSRYLATGASGSGYGTEVTYAINHGSDAQVPGQLSLHTNAVIDGPSLSVGDAGEKVWTFVPVDNIYDYSRDGLVSVLDQRTGPGGVSLKRDSYTWTPDTSTGSLYISNDVSVLNVGQPYTETSSVQQTVDGFGNVTQKKVFDYTSVSAPIRIYNYTYLGGSNYLDRYIRNRLASATVTDGNGANAVTLTTNAYDGTSCANATAMPDTSQAILHDPGYNQLFGVYRGNLTSQTTPQGNTCNLYDYLGNTYFTKAPHAPTVAVETSGATNGSNYSLPSQVTPNSSSSLSMSLTYSQSFAPSSFSGPNGATANATYDGFGWVLSSTGVDGAITYYTYSAAGVLPMTQKAQATVYNPFSNTNDPHRWTLTTLDGLGRPVSVQSGAGGSSTVVTETDTAYGPCACSPIGKMIQTSQPYAPGGSVYWTKYTYL